MKIHRLPLRIIQMDGTCEQPQIFRSAWLLRFHLQARSAPWVTASTQKHGEIWREFNIWYGVEWWQHLCSIGTVCIVQVRCLQWFLSIFTYHKWKYDYMCCYLVNRDWKRHKEIHVFSKCLTSWRSLTIFRPEAVDCYRAAWKWTTVSGGCPHELWPVWILGWGFNELSCTGSRPRAAGLYQTGKGFRVDYPSITSWIFTWLLSWAQQTVLPKPGVSNDFNRHVTKITFILFPTCIQLKKLLQFQKKSIYFFKLYPIVNLGKKK